MLADDIGNRIRAASDTETLARTLELLLVGGYAVWTDDTLLSIRQKVGMLKGLSLEIYAREHPPPHFHVRGADIDASFSILDCSLLAGDIRSKDYELVRWWHARAKSRLVAIWNDTRPWDCPVGPIVQD
jgi:hypothetical protein